jgi:tricorn protease
MLMVMGAVGLLLLASPALAGDARLMRHADVHGEMIVFTYEDDLWLVSTAGGDARRITSHPGVERYARFSPDGRWIAFTGGYDGGSDVYLMPSGGGVPQRLTFHPSQDRVLGWMPGGNEIFFRSDREMPQRGERVYTVAVEGGGMPKALPVDRAGLCAVSPDGKNIAYNRISREDRTWKRYRGGMAQNIWLGSMVEMDYRPVTDWTGTDNYPMWGNDDRIYFTSDREDGTLNLYRCDPSGGNVTRLTQYQDYDVKYPASGPGAIVYQYGEALYLFDLAKGTASPVHVNIPSDRVPLRPEYLSLDDNFGSFGLSPSGARLLLEARGELVNLPADEKGKGLTVNLTATSASREKNGAWSPDGKWIAFISDRSGEEEIYLVSRLGGEWRQVSRGGLGFRMQPVWSPDSSHLLFSDKFMRLNLLEVESGELSVIDQGPFDDAWERWGIQDYTWSPDSRWIAYTRMGGNLHESIWLYGLESGDRHQVTSEMTTDWSPSFDPQGRYLYFLSNRTFAPQMGLVDQNHIYLDMARPYLVLLQDDLCSPFAPEDIDEQGSDGNQDADEEDEKADADGATEPLVIHTADFERRTVAAEGVPAGNYFRLEALDDGFLFLARTEREFTKYQNVNDLTDGALELRHYVIEDREVKTQLTGIRNYHLSADRKKLVYRCGNHFGVIDAGKEAQEGDGRVDLETIRLRVDRGEEFLQIFNEAWRIQRDWFYDPGMHGLDWEATGEKYRLFVPWCGNRGDLNYLIGEMIGELNIGHTYIFGGDMGRQPPTVSVGLLGVDYAAPSGKGFHCIERIIPGTPWLSSERSPLDEPGCPIGEGDYIIAVNGRTVTERDNIHSFFIDTVGKPVRLTWNSTPAAEGAQQWLVTPLGSEREIRYRQWVESRRSLVDQASGGAIGYLHLPDMGERGLIEFARAFYPQVDKQAMIIDERYNGGGFVGDMIIDRLERRLWSYTVPREGGPGRNPERVGSDKLAVLINEDTGSNGEFFAEALKRKGLATIIGMRTWGGVVGIEPHQGFVDGGGTTPPQFGLLGTDRTWIVEGHGVEPDVEVQNMPGDVLRGTDSQLEAAIELLMKQIGDQPAGLPEIPAYPVKKKVTE